MKTIHLILSPLLEGRIKESSSLNKNEEDDKEYRHRTGARTMIGNTFL